MQTAPDKILMTTRQSPKYTVPGTRTWERTIAPTEHPAWARPIAVDLFWRGLKAQMIILAAGLLFRMFTYLFKVLWHNERIDHEAKVISSSKDDAKETAKYEWACDQSAAQQTNSH